MSSTQESYWEHPPFMTLAEAVVRRQEAEERCLRQRLLGKHDLSDREIQRLFDGEFREG